MGEFGVTIATDLHCAEVGGEQQFPFVAVLDLRPCSRFGARAIEEATLKRLAFFWVQYDQLPTDMRYPTTRQEKSLFSAICQHAGRVLILTGQPQEVARFCRGLDVPVAWRDLHLAARDESVLPWPDQRRTKPARLISSSA